MSLGLGLILIGVLFAVLVHWTLGLLLIVIGVVLLVVPALR